MTKTIRAHFDGKVIVPDEPVDLPADFGAVTNPRPRALSVPGLIGRLHEMEVKVKEKDGEIARNTNGLSQARAPRNAQPACSSFGGTRSVTRVPACTSAASSVSSNSSAVTPEQQSPPS